VRGINFGMYLKSVDLIGFKSFAEKTLFAYEPGITAIVGPNGCGKSNVSDAIRWVLGETRPTAIRGNSMEDCIFNGTDSHKPLGMAEVTLTLADCDKKLDLGAHEVSITRRVFRSGESDYFINKKACRRKDIHRLFMDTGVGTDSYSIMEQGKIDQILSSRPDDRRAVFEEASGITKYKADKKEALRKLEQTEANLLRLTDVIGEVKRQIISLQRQAGKAKRYKTLQTELRKLDLYVTRDRLASLTIRIEEIRDKLETLRKEVDKTHSDIKTADAETESLRAELQQMEVTISAAMDEAMRAKNELDRAEQTIRTNAERVTELETLADQNTRESEDAKRRCEQHRASLNEVTGLAAEAETGHETARSELETATGRQREAEEAVHAAREALTRRRNESMELDSRIGKLQTELAELDARERASSIKKEQLAAEKKNLQLALTSFEERYAAAEGKTVELRQAAETQVHTLSELSGKRSDAAAQIASIDAETVELQKQLAAKQARREMATETQTEDFPRGARHLLESGREEVVGPLAELLKAESDFEAALEAVLRPWMDALVIRDAGSARNLLTLLTEGQHGAARLLSLPDSTAPQNGKNTLLAHITCSAEVRPLATTLLANVFVSDSLQSVPLTLEAGAVFVTKQGDLLAADRAEHWQPEEGELNPLTRHHLREQLSEEIAQLEAALAQKRKVLEALRNEDLGTGDAIEAARRELDERRRALAVQEGESQVIARERSTARDRVETVTFELNALAGSKPDDQRSALARELSETRERLNQTRQYISTKTGSLEKLEEQRSGALTEASEARIQFSQREQRLEALHSRRSPLEARCRELEELIEERTRGVNTYRRRIDQLKQGSANAEIRLTELRALVADTDTKLLETRRAREDKNRSLAEREQALRTLQHRLEELQNGKTGLEVELAEQRMRHQNAVERLTSTYHITPEQIDEEPDPEWDNEAPPMEEIETMAAEYRAKLDAMGPVNLVAIDEHAELEERFAFLNQQQDDLLKAKEQLLDMIKKINQTTTEMFSKTFTKVNSNFSEIFKQLFGGGSAKLVLVDEEDILESGIEIIARPPGKKLQSISLLSGGERTMTAVALLFSLFKVKPSPFCVLDEIDAALDEANIGRFIAMLKGFLTQSQFILITHSRQTIAIADVIYGVTMPNRGISRIMSMKFAEYEKQDT